MWQYFHSAGSSSKACLYSYIPRNCGASSDHVPAASQFIFFFPISLLDWQLLDTIIGTSFL